MNLLDGKSFYRTWPKGLRFFLEIICMPLWIGPALLLFFMAWVIAAPIIFVTEMWEEFK